MLCISKFENTIMGFFGKKLAVWFRIFSNYFFLFIFECLCLEVGLLKMIYSLSESSPYLPANKRSMSPEKKCDLNWKNSGMLKLISSEFW